MTRSGFLWCFAVDTGTRRRELLRADGSGAVNLEPARPGLHDVGAGSRESLEHCIDSLPDVVGDGDVLIEDSLARQGRPVQSSAT